MTGVRELDWQRVVEARVFAFLILIEGGEHSIIVSQDVRELGRYLQNFRE